MPFNEMTYFNDMMRKRQEKIDQEIDKPVKADRKGLKQDQWEKTFPKGTVVKTTQDIIDPIDGNVLQAGSVLIIEEVSVQNAGVWLLCRIKKGSFESSWNIRPKDVRIYQEMGNKKGRYRIALQNTIGEDPDEVKIDPV